MTINTQKLRERAGRLTPPHIDVAMLLLGAADAFDTQTAEIAEARGQIEHLDRQNAGLRAQHDQDSKTLREYAQARDDLRQVCAALETEKTRLREALHDLLASLSESDDEGLMEHAEVVISARAALSGESKC